MCNDFFFFQVVNKTIYKALDSLGNYCSIRGLKHFRVCCYSKLKITWSQRNLQFTIIFSLFNPCVPALDSSRKIFFRVTCAATETRSFLWLLLVCYWWHSVSVCQTSTSGHNCLCCSVFFCVFFTLLPYLCAGCQILWRFVCRLMYRVKRLKLEDENEGSWKRWVRKRYKKVQTVFLWT